ncbi:hypothetical protein MKL18_13505 [Enterococcus faecalis]|uniref:hypothetical protein n=1 Tax=Enterococcus faecalis TaxID=1351 RepID=UPI001F06EFFB|nr:hypothetical protein [Enterococcus faecalis]MCH1672947.1 hypothetical protein [Enterococcus faecalis]
MENEKWYTLSEAGRKLGKSRNYFSVMKRQQPQYFEGVELREYGQILLISEDGIQTVLSRVKKGGVHINNRLIIWTQKNKGSILPTPPNALV